MPKHPHNSRHSRLLERAALVGWTLAIVGSLAAATFYARLILPTDQMAAVITSALVNLTNKDREEENLGTLTVNPKLVAAAQAKANDMAEKGYFAHNSPDGTTSWYWFRAADYSFVSAGENLAVNFNDSVDVERAWMNSPSHRANILNGRFTEIGIATAVGEYQGKKTIFVVQMFGTPAQSETVATVREIVPQDPRELAVATVEPAPSVLGSEVVEPKEGEAAAAAAVGASGKPIPAEAPVAAVVEPSSEISAPAPETLVTSPKTLLRNLYLLGAVTLMLIIGMITRLELRRHHMRHVAVAGLLLVLMGGMFMVADRFLFPTPVVGQELPQ